MRPSKTLHLFSFKFEKTPGEGTIAFQVLITGAIMLSYVLVYYLQYLHIFPRYFNRKKLLFFAAFVNLIIFQLSSYFIFYYLITIEGGKGFYDGYPIYALALNQIIFFFIIIITSHPAFQKKINITEIRDQGKREKLLLTRKLSFIKNQFNSQITLDFLNYCYAQIHKNSKEDATALKLFSDMVRHNIENEVNKLIPLKNEINYISNFIELHRCLSKDIYVNFEILGETSNKYILPRILITFIENAFKHGESYSKENPISILLDISSDRIRFKVVNRKKISRNNIISTGIGNHNVKQQLEIFYKDKYRLKIREISQNYECELILPTFRNALQKSLNRFDLHFWF